MEIVTVNQKTMRRLIKRLKDLGWNSQDILDLLDYIVT